MEVERVIVFYDKNPNKFIGEYPIDLNTVGCALDPTVSHYVNFTEAHIKKVASGREAYDINILKPYPLNINNVTVLSTIFKFDFEKYDYFLECYKKTTSAKDFEHLVPLSIAKKETDKELAAKFAIWLNKNRWFNFDDESQKWCYTFEMGTAMTKKAYQKDYMKTSDELWYLFNNE